MDSKTTAATSSDGMSQDPSADRKIIDIAEMQEGKGDWQLTATELAEMDKNITEELKKIEEEDRKISEEIDKKIRTLWSDGKCTRAGGERCLLRWKTSAPYVFSFYLDGGSKQRQELVDFSQGETHEVVIKEEKDDLMSVWIGDGWIDYLSNEDVDFVTEQQLAEEKRAEEEEWRKRAASGEDDNLPF